jgi:sigma-B regulation protein RsbU (phosphoserine phosphatase)
MAGVAHTLEHDVDRSAAAVAARLRAVLAPLNIPVGISVFLKTPLGRSLAVAQYGQAVPSDATGDSNREESRGVESSPSPAKSDAFSFALDDGNQVIVRDDVGGSGAGALIGAVLRASLEAQEAKRREELLLEELGANWESLEALYEISTDALRSGDINDALKRLIERLAALQDGLRSALYIRREEIFYPLVSTERDLASLAAGQLGLVEKAIRDMRVVLVNRLARNPDPQACWRNATSLAAAPFSWQGCVGFVVVWHEDGDFEFDSPFSRVLEAITYQASVMMEGDRLNRKVRENELLAQEVEIASSIQQTLLLANAPREVPALEMAACSIASRQIDGDFHDFFQHPDGTVDVLIGDVMGKGVAAALLGAATKSQFLRAVANLALRSKDGAPHPAEIVTRAASRLSDRLISLDRFVTLCYARFDAATRKLIFVDCGHTSMIVESKTRPECAFLRGADLPLGVLPNYRCEGNSVEFQPGETYFLYSDGVTENRSPEGELFGAERLAECVQNWSALGPAILVEQIRKEAALFAQSEKFSDDFTCIAVRVKIKSKDEEPVSRRSTAFDCDRGALTDFHSWLERCAAASGTHLGEEDAARLQLACSEVFTNCAIHGRDSSGTNRIGVEVRGFQNHVAVRFTHRGPAFDPLAVPPPAFDGSREGGFGIFIVLRSADEVTFTRTPDETNVITLSFLRGTTDRSS